MAVAAMLSMIFGLALAQGHGAGVAQGGWHGGGSVPSGGGKAKPLLQCEQSDRAALIKCLEPNRRVEVEAITLERRAS